MMRALLALIAVICITYPAAAWQNPPPKPPAQEGFVPVDDLPAQEQLPAAPLVAIAYGFAWAAILVYVWSLWRRLGRVEREFAALQRRLTEQERNASGVQGPPPIRP
jgi:CcmD family protein